MTYVPGLTDWYVPVLTDKVMHPGAIQKSSVYLNVTYTTKYWSDKVFHFNAQNLLNYSAAVRSKKGLQGRKAGG